MIQRPSEIQGASDPRYRDRIRGCLLGGAVGDALGAGVEFTTWEDIELAHGPHGVQGYVPAYGRLGAVTDDTQMTIFTVEGLLRALVRADKGITGLPDVVWCAYQRWLVTQGVEPLSPCDGVRSGWVIGEQVLFDRRAPGNTCLRGLRRATPREPLPQSCTRSKGCGSVMRSAPFGLFRSWERTAVASTATECSHLTHGHPTAGHSSAALALMVHGLVNGRSLPAAVDEAVRDLRRLHPDAEETALAVSRAVDTARTDGAPTVGSVHRLGGGWVAEEALAIAVYCALASGDDVRAAMLASVNHSGDSDSKGAICGNLLGAALGDDAFPAAWTAGVEARGILLQLADDVYYEATRGSELHTCVEADEGWLTRYPGC